MWCDAQLRVGHDGRDLEFTGWTFVALRAQRFACCDTGAIPKSQAWPIMIGPTRYKIFLMSLRLWHLSERSACRGFEVPTAAKGLVHRPIRGFRGLV